MLEQDDGAALDAIARAVVEAARAGDINFVRLVWDRAEGPVRLRVEHDTTQHVKVIEREVWDGV